MPESINVPYTPIIIRYKGLFDWDGLYLAIADWLKRYRYFFHEEMYKHKVPSPRGAEQELYWYADVNVTEYIKFRINIWFHLWDMTEVEIIKDGKKKILTNARLEIKMRGEEIIDWEDRFEKTRFWRALRHWYNWYVIRRELESGWGDTLIYRMTDLQAFIKKYLDMQASAHEWAGYMGENR